jgi:hypothetical protein
MSATTLRATTLFALLAIVFPLNGCMKYRDEMILLPDGSGKLVLHFSFNLEVLEKFKEMGLDLEEAGGIEKEMEFDMEEVDHFEGIVALTQPKADKKDGWKSWTVTAYFEDINKVKIFEKDEETDEKKLQMAYTFRKEGEGHVLEIDDRFMEDDEMDEAGVEAGLEMIKEHLKGFEVSRSVKMPGPVTSAKGFAKKEGRSAVHRIDESSLKDKDGVLDLMKAVKRRVVSGKSEVTDAEAAAFKKELEEAKAAWPKIKAEMKAAAEKKQKGKKDE